MICCSPCNETVQQGKNFWKGFLLFYSEYHCKLKTTVRLKVRPGGWQPRYHGNEVAWYGRCNGKTIFLSIFAQYKFIIIITITITVMAIIIKL